MNLDTAASSVDEPPDLIWPFQVDSLCKLCVKYIVSELHYFCHLEPNENRWSLRPGVYLPPQISEDLLREFQRRKIDLSDGLLHIFSDKAAAPLRRVKINASEGMTDKGLRYLLAHYLIDLDITWHHKLTEKSYLMIQEYGRNLTRLAIRNAAPMLKYDLLKYLPENPGFRLFVETGDLSSIDPLAKALVMKKIQQTEEDAIAIHFTCPKLRSLTIHSLCLIRHRTPDYLESVCRPLHGLTYIDLSHCPVLVDSLVWLKGLPHLLVLILHCVPITSLKEAFDNIGHLKSLRTLDVSTSHRNSHIFADGGVELEVLLEKLPNLCELDLSGTNIGIPTDTVLRDGRNKSGIQGLHRDDLEFLGLLGCPGFDDGTHTIKAKRVAGSWGVEEMLCAGRVYAERKGMVTMILPSLVMSLRSVEYQEEQYQQALTIVLDILHLYLNSYTIAHYSVLSLASILDKHMGKTKWINTRMKRTIILSLLDLMECQWLMTHFNKAELMRKCCATLSYFDLAKDLVFAYERVVTMLLSLITIDGDLMTHQAVQTAIYILRYMSSQVDVRYKEMAGQLGCIKKMLSVINCCVEADNDGSPVLVRAWSVLWSLTDMSPANCERFLEHDGLKTFMYCFRWLPNDSSLTNKIFGMLRNVVEVPHLRPALMTEEYITIFSYMLHSELNISNSACSILAHLLADGPESWTVQIPVDDLIGQMTVTIERWDLNERHNVRYRSFEPMLQLLKCYNPMICMYWAAWEVTNMVLKDATRYCPILDKEGGILLLQELLSDPRPTEKIRQLAELILEEWESWKRTLS